MTLKCLSVLKSLINITLYAITIMLLFATEQFLNCNNCENLRYTNKTKENKTSAIQELSVQNLQCLTLKWEVWVYKFCLNFCGKLLLILNYVPNAHQSEVRERKEGRQ